MADQYSVVTFGVAKELITPREPMSLMGFDIVYGVPFTDIHDDLYAKALVLTDADGETVLLVTADLCFHDDSLTEALRDYAAERYGVKRSHLHMTYTHTHFGPIQKGYHKYFYTDSYEAFLLDRICAAIDRAYLNRRKGTLWFSYVSGDWNVNRRQLREDGSRKLAPNPNDERDPNLYLLRLNDEEGNMRVLATNFACHPSNLGQYTSVSSEYPGRLCARIEGEFYGCTAIFFQGFGSDAKLKIGMKTAARFTTISYEECNDVASSMLERIKGKMITSDWQQLPVRLDSRTFSLELPLEVYPKSFFEEDLKRYADGPGVPFAPKPGTVQSRKENSRMMNWYFADDLVSRYEELPDRLTLPCGMVRINPEFYICSMGGEPSVNIQTVLRKAFPEVKLLCFGFANDLAYIPSDKIIEEGGYEAEGSVIEYRLKGRIAPGVDEIFCRGYGAAMADMANSL